MIKNKGAMVLALAACGTGALLAQDGESISVPLDDPGRPARIQAQLLAGGITVRGADIKNVTVAVQDRGNGREPREHHHSNSKAEGMKRIDLPASNGLEITEQGNVVTIRRTMVEGGANLVINVPRRSSLQLKCMNDGDIKVDGVEGEIDANDLNGNITLNGVAGSVLAHSLNGEVQATLDRIDPSKPLSFSTLNGDIDVTLPPSLQANIVMKTDHGEIYSDFEVKLNNTVARTSDSGRQSNGSYRLRFDHSLRGTINGGGPEIQFTTFNGQIYLRKKK